MISPAHSFAVVESSRPAGPLRVAHVKHAHHPFLRAIRALLHNR